MLKGRKGFTLIELLIVVAIIGIIAAIAVPTLISTRGAAVKSKATANLRTVSSAQTAYLAKYGVYVGWPTLVGGDTDGVKYLDTRWVTGFVEDGVTYTDVGPNPTWAAGFKATALLPTGVTLTIDETGRIY